MSIKDRQHVARKAEAFIGCAEHRDARTRAESMAAAHPARCGREVRDDPSPLGTACRWQSAGTGWSWAAGPQASSGCTGSAAAHAGGARAEREKRGWAGRLLLWGLAKKKECRPN